MKSCDTSRIFKNTAAVLRFRRDQFADLALADESRRVRAGCSVGEQKLHVFGAHFLAVDAIDRAQTAPNAARDFEDVFLVERRGRAARCVLQNERDIRVFARWTPCAALEDHVVHVGRAHGLGARRAHDPTHRFQQVRLAATVRADDARQTLFDRRLSRIDEALEAVEAQLGDMHVAATSVR